MLVCPRVHDTASSRALVPTLAARGSRYAAPGSRMSGGSLWDSYSGALVKGELLCHWHRESGQKVKIHPLRLHACRFLHSLTNGRFGRGPGHSGKCPTSTKLSWTALSTSSSDTLAGWPPFLDFLLQLP
jgi:hypothetical protein